IVFRWAVAAFTALALAALAPGRGGRLALFALLNALALGLGQVYDFHLLVLVGLGALAALQLRSLPAFAALAVLTAPLGLTKFSLGIGALAIILVAAAVFGLRGRIGGAVAAVAVHAGCAVILAIYF